MADVEHNRQVTEALAEAVPRLPLRSGVQKLFLRNWPKVNADDEMLERVGSPLSLAKPSELALQLEACGGAKYHLSPEARTSVNSRLTDCRADRVLGQLVAAVMAMMQSYRRGELTVSLSVAARGLATLALSSLIHGNESIRRDLAAVLSADPNDGASLIRRYRTVIDRGDTAIVEAVDGRIMCDETWGPWAQVFLREGSKLAEPPEPARQWEFSTAPAAEESANEIRGWLFRRR